MLKLEKREKLVVNRLIEQWFCRMFEVKCGLLYLLLDHHKYMDYKKHSRRIKVGKSTSKDGFYYITQPIK